MFCETQEAPQPWLQPQPHSYSSMGKIALSPVVSVGLGALLPPL